MLVKLALAGLAPAIVGFSVSCGANVPDGITDVRVCTGSAYDSDDEECSVDQRATPISASTFYCTAKVGDRGGETASFRILLGGTEVTSDELRLPGDFSGTVHYKITGFTLAKRRWTGPLPGGAWRCELTVGGEHAQVSFRSSGPRHLVVGTAVCRRGSPEVRVCARDESAAPISPGVVSCTAEILSPTGGRVKIDLLRNGRTAVAGVPFRFAPGDRGVVQQFPVAKGTFACRFLIDGRAAALKPFTVG